MLILLLIVAHAMHAVKPKEMQKCKHLDTKYVLSHITHVEDVIYLNPTSGARYLGELAQCWKSTCCYERYNAGTDLVRRLSSLLSHEHAILTVSSMLIDIGPNLKDSQSDVEFAIIAEAAREDARFKASGPVMPETGEILSDSLKCVRLKMTTGKLDEKYRRYVENPGYRLQLR